MGLRRLEHADSTEQRRRFAEVDRTRTSNLKPVGGPPSSNAPATTTSTAALDTQTRRPTDASRKDARDRMRNDASVNYLAYRTQGALPQETPAPASDPAVDNAVRDIKKELGEDVDQDDLEHINDIWHGLNAEQARAVFDRLSPEEIEKWGSEAQRSTGWTDNGLTGEQQQGLFNDLAGKLTADQLDRVAGAFDNQDRMRNAVRDHAPAEVRDEYLMGSPTDPITVLDLNVAGGNGNSPRSSVGMDPGDIDELAKRIVDGDVDVATLQEVWKMDIPKLEEELEKRTGDEWDLHFVEASSKYRWDDGGWPVRGYANEPFGNVIAVRRGEGVAASEVVGREKIDSPGSVGEGSDGRSALAVRVYTAGGGSMVIATAHTDTSNDIASAEERGREISEVRRFAEGVADGDPVIVTGDFNSTIDGEGATGDALRDYLDHGYTDAGDVGPTSDYGNGRRIDFVFAGDGLETSAPRRFEGDSPDQEGEDHDLADHDGIILDVTIPYNGRSRSGVPGGGDFDYDARTRPSDDYR